MNKEIITDNLKVEPEYEWLISFDDLNSLVKTLEFQSQITTLHFDTRDFGFLQGNKKIPVDLSIVSKQKSRKYFFYDTIEDVLAVIKDLCERSSARDDNGNIKPTKWRLIQFEGEGEMFSSNWQMKYLRCYKSDYGWVICDDKDYILRKSILRCDINKEFLNAH